MRKESAHSQKFTLAIEHQIPVLLGEVDPCHVQRDPGCLRVSLQISEQRPVLRLGPRLDRAFGQRFQLVGNDKVEIEVDGIAESLAFRAGAVRIVEGEKPRLGLLVADIAVLALKALREAKCSRGAALLARLVGCSEYSKMTSPDSR